MKCPYCDIEMLDGFFLAPWMIWRESPTGWIPPKKGKYAMYLRMPWSTPNNVPSTCCSKCKRIIIDSSSYENNLD